MSMGARLLIWVLALAIGFGGGYAGYVARHRQLVQPVGGAAGHRRAAALPIAGIDAFDPAGRPGREQRAARPRDRRQPRRPRGPPRATSTPRPPPRTASASSSTSDRSARVDAVQLDQPADRLVGRRLRGRRPRARPSPRGVRSGRPGTDLGQQATLSAPPDGDRPVRAGLVHQARPGVGRSVPGAHRRGLGPWHPGLTARPTPSSSAPRPPATATRSTRCSTRHVDRLHAVCRRICGPDAAFDATQRALIAITRSIARFDGRAAFTTWSHRIAVNAALDEVRGARRRAVPASDHLARHDPPAPRAAGPERVVDRLDLEAALAALPEDFRVAVVLRDVADLDYAEIAATLDIPIGTVRSRIARGRAALADGAREPRPRRRRPRHRPWLTSPPIPTSTSTSPLSADLDGELDAYAADLGVARRRAARPRSPTRPPTARRAELAGVRTTLGAGARPAGDLDDVTRRRLLAGAGVGTGHRPRPSAAGPILDRCGPAQRPRSRSSLVGALYALTRNTGQSADEVERQLGRRRGRPPRSPATSATSGPIDAAGVGRLLARSDAATHAARRRPIQRTFTRQDGAAAATPRRPADGRARGGRDACAESVRDGRARSGSAARAPTRAPRPWCSGSTPTAARSCSSSPPTTAPRCCTRSSR